MPRPFRFWMTGCVAVVLAAVGGTRVVAAERSLQSTASRYDVVETVERIEACARQHGLGVFARMAEPASASTIAPEFSRGQHAVIVFASGQGGTPVLMTAANARPDLALMLYVRDGPSGGVEVLMPNEDWSGLPPDVAHDVAELPRVVAEALA